MTVDITVGYSPFHHAEAMVLEHSIRRRSSVPIDIRHAPIHEDVLQFPREPHQTTPFAFTRFLTPRNWGGKGFSVFMDPDMLCLCDFREIQELFDSKYVVQVVKHDYVPRSTEKYVGIQLQKQYSYERKNWSSFIIFNNQLCQELYTKDVLASTPGLALNTFRNIPDELIGSIPKQFNFLVDEDNQEGPPKILHYTNGTPNVATVPDEYAKVWNEELDNAANDRWR